MVNTLHIDFDKIKSSGELNALRKSVNESFDKTLSDLRVKEKGAELSNKPFGYIKECFESLSETLYNTNKGKKIIGNYINTIKESKDLSTLHSIYENLRKTGNDSDVDYFVNNIIKNKVNKSTIDEDVKKLGKVLESAYCYLGESVNSLLPVGNEKLDSAINYIVENKESNKNLSEYSAAIKILREDIGKRENSISFEFVSNLDDTAEKLVREFNEKYSDMLSEGEMNIVTEIAKSNKPEDVFNMYKEICEDKMRTKKSELERNGDIESAKRVATIQEQIRNKTCSVDTIIDDINNIFEITKIFE